MEHIMLSIIIPVYNVEKHIQMTLDSCLNQDVSASTYEIVCINDGSTDNSLAILEEYKVKHENIRVFTQPNGGVSAARNKGISLARGKYIWFVDSDDLIANNCLGAAFQALTYYDADIFNFETSVRTSRELFDADQSITFETCDEDELTKLHFLTYDDTKWLQEVWRYWFKRSMLIDNNIFYNSKSAYGEDSTFSFTATIYAQKSIRTGATFYQYYQHTGSAISRINTDKRFLYIDSLIENARYLKSITKDKSKYWKDIGNIKANYFLYTVTSKIVKEGNISYAKEKIKQMKTLGVYPYPMLWDTIENKSLKQSISALFKLFFNIEWYLMLCVSCISIKRMLLSR